MRKRNPLLLQFHVKYQTFSNFFLIIFLCEILHHKWNRKGMTASFAIWKKMEVNSLLNFMLYSFHFNKHGHWKNPRSPDVTLCAYVVDKCINPSLSCSCKKKKKKIWQVEHLTLFGNQHMRMTTFKATEFTVYRY